MTDRSIVLAVIIGLMIATATFHFTWVMTQTPTHVTSHVKSLTNIAKTEDKNGTR